jgi:hypothetical protein
MGKKVSQKAKVKSAKFPAFLATRGHSPFLHGLANWRN